MDIQQSGLLSNEDLDVVVGGMMNNGQGQSLQTQPKNGGPGNSSQDGLKFLGGLATFGAILIFSLGF